MMNQSSDTHSHPAGTVKAPGHRVTIGLPVFNGERYLEAAIQSLLVQTFDDFQLIICDNASTDRTSEICRGFALSDPRVQYHRNAQNLGATRNFNRTFDLSSSEYFRWASYDDLVAPELLERCVAVLDADPSAVLCYPRTVVIDEEGHQVETHEGGLDLPYDDPVRRHRAFMHRFRTNAWCEPIFGVMRSEALRMTALLGNYNSADVTLLEELALRGTFHEVPEHLFFRRVHPLISTRANTTAEAVAEWFDPRNRGRVLAPRWRLFFEHYKAVGASPLGRVGKIRCHSQVGVEMVRWGPELSHELMMLAMAKLLRRPVGRSAR